MRILLFILLIISTFLWFESCDLLDAKPPTPTEVEEPIDTSKKNRTKLELTISENGLFGIDSIINISTNSVEVIGGVNKIDSTNIIIQHGHLWGDSTRPTINDNPNKTTFGPLDIPGGFKSNISNLEPGKTYYVRSYIQTDFGTFYNPVTREFTTNSPSEVTVEIGEVRSITARSAYFNGTIKEISNGVKAFGHVWSETDQLPSIEDERTDLGVNRQAGIFSSKLNNLEPSTTYFVRAYAVDNSDIVVYSDEIMSFTTARGDEWKLVSDNLFGNEVDVYFGNELFSSFTLNNSFYIGRIRYGYQGSPEWLLETLEFRPGSNRWLSYPLVLEDDSPNQIIAQSRFGEDHIVLSDNGRAFALFGRLNNNNLSDLIWEFDETRKSWVQVDQLRDWEVEPRYRSINVSLNNKGYIGFGLVRNPDESSDQYYINKSDLWEFDFEDRDWKELPAFPGDVRNPDFAFTLNGKLYIGGGENENSFLNWFDLWVYDPKRFSWKQLNNLPEGMGKYNSFVTTLNNKAYVGVGFVGGGSFEGTVWEYDPEEDSWTKGEGVLPTPEWRQFRFSFQLENKIYGLGGSGPNGTKPEWDLWEYVAR